MSWCRDEFTVYMLLLIRFLVGTTSAFLANLAHTGTTLITRANTAMDCGESCLPQHLLASAHVNVSGPLIFYDPNDPHADLYDVDDEGTVIVLGDWYRVRESSSEPELPMLIIICCS